MFMVMVAGSADQFAQSAELGGEMPQSLLHDPSHPASHFDNYLDLSFIIVIPDTDTATQMLANPKIC